MTTLIDINHDSVTDLSEWTSVTDTGSDLSNSVSAGLAGTSRGMAVRINDTQSPFATKQVTDSTTGVVRVRFYLDVNSLAMNNNTNHFLGNLRNASGNICTFRLNYATAVGHSILCQLVRDADTISTSQHAITDEPHYIEVRVVRSTGSGNTDGSLDLWIDGVHQQQVTGDNFNTFDLFRQLRLGATSGVDATTSGTYYIDQIIVNDDGSEIGAHSSGTQYTQSVDGGMTPAGSLLKQADKLLSGGNTPSGLLAKLSDKSFTGSITPSGSIAKLVEKALSGALSSIVGTLETSRVFLKILEGAITPSGSLSKQAQVAFTGTLTLAGNIAKRIDKALTGAITSSGALLKSALKTLSGDITPQGSISKLIDKFLSGTLASLGSVSGTLIGGAQDYFISLSGEMTPAGSLLKSISKPFSGELTLSGNISKTVDKVVAGVLTPVGTLSKAISKAFAGTLGISGSLSKTADKTFSGNITPSGEVEFVKLFVKMLEGGINFIGTLSKDVSKTLAGNISPVGTLNKFFEKILTGNLSFSGALSILHGVIEVIDTIYLLGSKIIRVGLRGSRDLSELVQNASEDALVILRGAVDRIVSFSGRVRRTSNIRGKRDID